MDFSDEESIVLINLYKSHEILWNPRHPQYKMSKKKIDFWLEIASKMGKDVNSIKQKMESLLASYRRERQREGRSNHSGAGTDEIYHSQWFAYAEMTFLNDKFTPRTTKDTINLANTTQQQYNSSSLDSSLTTVNDDIHGDTSRIEENTQHVSIGVPENTSSEFLPDVGAKVTSDITVQIPHIQKKKKTFISPKKMFGKKNQEDPRIAETFKIIQDISRKKQLPREARDDCSIFGELITFKMRKLDSHMRTVVQHQISNILFDAEVRSMYKSKTTAETQSFMSVSTPSSPFYEMPIHSPTYSSTCSPLVEETILFPSQSPLMYTHPMESPSSLKQYQETPSTMFQNYQLHQLHIRLIIVYE